MLFGALFIIFKLSSCIIDDDFSALEIVNPADATQNRVSSEFSSYPDIGSVSDVVDKVIQHADDANLRRTSKYFNEAILLSGNCVVSDFATRDPFFKKYIHRCKSLTVDI